MSRQPDQTLSLHRLGAVVAGIGAAQVVLLTLVPIISEACNLSIATIGSLVALGTFCFMLAGPLWGEVSDRRGRKPVVIAGLGGAWVAQLLFVGVLVMMAGGLLAAVSGIVLLGLSRLLYGLSAAGIYPACQAWAVDNQPASRRLATLSSLSAAANLGRVLGPLLALPALGLATLSGSKLWPLAWLLILPLVSLVLVASLPAGRAQAGHEREPVSLNISLSALFAIAVLGTAAIGQMQVMLGPVLTDYYGMTAVEASSGAALLLLAVAVVSVLVQLGVVRRLQAPRLCLVLGSVLMLAGCGLLWPGLGSWLAFWALLVFVAGVACLVPGYTTLVSQQGGGRHGRVFGLLTLMHTGGYTLGFAAGGWIYTHLPQWPLAGLLAAVCLLAAAVVPAIYPAAGRNAAGEPAADSV